MKMTLWWLIHQRRVARNDGEERERGERDGETEMQMQTRELRLRHRYCVNVHINILWREGKGPLWSFIGPVTWMQNKVPNDVIAARLS